MIEVQIKPFTLHIEGHAGYAERGKDIICSASSILMYTLEETLDRYEKLGMCKVNKTYYPGYVHLNAEPIGASDGVVLEAFNIINRGYEILECQYPDYVSLKKE